MNATLAADERRIVDLHRDTYTSKAKRRIRSRIVSFLSRCDPELVLDAWGGGLSAETMTISGLQVLSVDDFRQAASLGIATKDVTRTLSAAGLVGGYRTAVGSLDRFAPSCDAAFLDFVGFFSGEVERTVAACRHMKALVVTLVASRAPIGQAISRSTWKTMYRAALETQSGMLCDWIDSYVSRGGQPIMVFALRPSGHVISCANPECTETIKVHNSKRRYCTDRCKRRAYYLADPGSGPERTRNWKSRSPGSVAAAEARRRDKRAALRQIWQRERLCRACENVFVPKVPHALYCGGAPCLKTRDRQLWTERNRLNSVKLRESYQGRPCKNCGDTYVPTRGNQRHCSIRCRENYRNRHYYAMRKDRRMTLAVLPEAA